MNFKHPLIFKVRKSGLSSFPRSTLKNDSRKILDYAQSEIGVPLFAKFFNSNKLEKVT